MSIRALEPAVCAGRTAAALDDGERYGGDNANSSPRCIVLFATETVLGALADNLRHHGHGTDAAAITLTLVILTSFGVIAAGF